MLRRFAVSLVLIVLMVFVGGAATQELTDTAVAAAIARGEETDIKDIGLSLRTLNKGQRVAAYLLRREGESGWEKVSLQVYTPLEFIALKAAEAAVRFSKLAPGQVTAEMQRPVLRIYVSHGVENAVLRRSKDDTLGVQPSAKSVCDSIIYFDGKAQTSCLLFEFDLGSIRELLADKFLITVQALGEHPRRIISRDFQVERQQLSRLPL